MRLRFRRLTLPLLATVALAALPTFPRNTVAAVIESQVYDELVQSSDGRAYVIVLLGPSKDVVRMGLTELQTATRDAQTRVLGALPAADFEAMYVYESVPAFTGRATAAAIEILENHPDVVSVGPDQPCKATLASSVPFHNADDVHALGITGKGITVAVLDTGIDTDHPDLSDNIAMGAWHFLQAGGNQGPGAEDDNGHGTAASGVITSAGVVAPVGIAPDTDILAIKVLDAGGSGFLSDWTAGINYVTTNAGNYAYLCAISMSLGSFQLFTSCPCNGAGTGNQAAQAAITAARNAGILTFAASANDASTNSMAAPACLDGAIAVAAVYDGAYGQVNWSNCTDVGTQADMITCFTNRSPCNNLAGVGAFITTPGLGGGTTGFGGTSGATPHCAGIAALMCEHADSIGLSLTPDQIETIMQITGHPTIDPATTSPNPKRVDALLSVGSLEPGPAPIASSVAPASGYIDTDVQVVLTGSNFSAFTSADFGAGVLTNTTTTLSPDTMLVDLTIAMDAPLGTHDVTVFNPFDADTLFAAFNVRPTYRHYVSPDGSATPPYITPADAANLITDALAAASDGDTVLVDTMTVTGSLIVSKGVILSGGWMDGFTSRDLETKKTKIDLENNGTVHLLASGGTVGLDGFLLQDGDGVSFSIPVIGDYGGAVHIFSATAAVTNCEIRNSDVAISGGFGGGGGIFAYESAVTITNNHIHNNDATRGGGIYLYGCSGVVADNTVENNTGTAGSSKNPQGAGVALENCSGVTLTDNSISSNTGAENGGGVWVYNSDGVTVDGGIIDGHSASFSGGGVAFVRSSGTCDGVEISQNSSTVLGGGIVSSDTSMVTVTDCSLRQNSSLIGGGIYAQLGTADIMHNLFILNTASNSGGAMFLSTLSSGVVTGNTADQNSGPSGAGGFDLGNFPGEVFNNIVTNSTGAGIRCTGTPPPLTYNLVWNSSGSDYSGCSAGTGSLSADPLFVDAPATDYHLALHSPAIDTGRPGAPYQDPDGSPGDMGRYGSHAFVMDQPSYPKNLGFDTVSGDVILSWEPNPEADIDSYAVYCDSTSGFAPSLDNFVGSSVDTTLNVGSSTDTLYYRLSAVDTSGYASGYATELCVAPGSATSVPDIVRFVNSLDQNVPNPFNPETIIRYSIAQPSHVELVIYDVAGRHVRTLVDEAQPPQRYQVRWDGTNSRGLHVASGVYFYRLHAGAFTRTRKMIVLK